MLCSAYAQFHYAYAQYNINLSSLCVYAGLSWALDTGQWTCILKKIFQFTIASSVGTIEERKTSEVSVLILALFVPPALNPAPPVNYTCQPFSLFSPPFFLFVSHVHIFTHGARGGKKWNAERATIWHFQALHSSITLCCYNNRDLTSTVLPE